MLDHVKSRKTPNIVQTILCDTIFGGVKLLIVLSYEDCVVDSKNNNFQEKEELDIFARIFSCIYLGFWISNIFK